MGFFLNFGLDFMKTKLLNLRCQSIHKCTTKMIFKVEQKMDGFEDD